MMKPGRRSLILINCPPLIDDLEHLKSYMQGMLIGDLTPESKFTVAEWNEAREQAKELFTYPCISELDASGFLIHLQKMTGQLKPKKK